MLMEVVLYTFVMCAQASYGRNMPVSVHVHSMDLCKTLVAKHHLK